MGFGAQAAQSSSSSYGYNVAESLSNMLSQSSTNSASSNSAVGSSVNSAGNSSFGSSQNNSSNLGTSSAQSGDRIWNPQAQQLEALYNQTGGLAQAQQGEAARLGKQLAGDLSAMGNGYQQTLQGLADPTAQIAAQEASLKSGLGSLFRDEINPSLTAGAVGAGGMGGGRQGVAQGVAAGQIADSYTQGLGDITAAANAQAGTAASAGLSSLPMMQNLGMSGLTSAWLPYQMQAGILGGPTALGSSSSQSRNVGQSAGSSTSGSEGWSSGSSSTKSKGSSSSKSKSKSKAKSGSTSRSEQSAKSDSFSVGVSVGV